MGRKIQRFLKYLFVFFLSSLNPCCIIICVSFSKVVPSTNYFSPDKRPDWSVYIYILYFKNQNGKFSEEIVERLQERGRCEYVRIRIVDFVQKFSRLKIVHFSRHFLLSSAFLPLPPPTSPPPPTPFLSLFFLGKKSSKVSTRFCFFLSKVFFRVFLLFVR